MIDSIPNKFPTDRLLERKRLHESWVQSTLKRDVTAFSNDEFNIESLGRITSGRRLMDILSGSHAYHFDYPEPENREQMENLAAFFQMMQDYGDILADLDAADHIRIGFDLNDNIAELEAMNFALFGNSRKMKARFTFEEQTKEPVDWNVATLVAVRPDNPSIFGDFMIAGFPKKTSLR